MNDRIRIAAVGDIHLAEDLRGRYATAIEGIEQRADVLLIAGDLTQHGTTDEAQVVADEFRECTVPVITVLGNHDYHSGEEREIRRRLEAVGMIVLEGEGHCLETAGGRLGVAGVKGFCLGFSGRCAADFGEPEMKGFTRHGKASAAALAEALDALECDVSVALTHYSPVDDTLQGEPPEIWPFLGNYLLGEAIDESGAALAFHGHAHAGTEKGVTSGGVPVRNVAQPVLRSAFGIYEVASSLAAV
jgi:Icc-related predicted phosphoesterase